MRKYNLVDGETGRIERGYDTLRGAKIANTRLFNGRRRIVVLPEGRGYLNRLRAEYLWRNGVEVERDARGNLTGRVATRNILNPESHTIWIDALDFGSCVDPGTERYHCM